MEASELAGSDTVFLALFSNGKAVAMGALKRLSTEHGELKSMHVVDEHRGCGLADVVLGHLLDEARNGGMVRVSLETGSQDAFTAALAFYKRHGFDACAPFEGYAADPNSVFMTREVVA